MSQRREPKWLMSPGEATWRVPCPSQGPGFGKRLQRPTVGRWARRPLVSSDPIHSSPERTCASASFSWRRWRWCPLLSLSPSFLFFFFFLAINAACYQLMWTVVGIRGVFNPLSYRADQNLLLCVMIGGREKSGATGQGFLRNFSFSLCWKILVEWLFTS